MKTGMLWFDNQGAVEDRIRRAAAYYEKKFGISPSVCFLNPKENNPGWVGSVAIRSDRRVLLNHYWLGMEATE